MIQSISPLHSTIAATFAIPLLSQTDFYHGNYYKVFYHEEFDQSLASTYLFVREA